MEMVLDYSLTAQEPEHEYPLLDTDNCFFIGHIIKNKYDENRLHINSRYNPQRFSFNTNNGKYNLYGIFKEAALNNKLITELRKNTYINIGEYSSILAMNKLSCLSCFLHFSPGLYPIDSIYSKRFFSDIDESHFTIKKDIPTFQWISSIYLFTLINYHKN